MKSKKRPAALENLAMQASYSDEEAQRLVGQGCERLPGALQTKGEWVDEVNPKMIRPSPFQSRLGFGGPEDDRLVSSLREKAILLHPLVVRPVRDAAERIEAFELIAGERRLRAVTQLGWQRVPVRVLDVDDATAIQLAWIENHQRKRLSYFEEARHVLATQQMLESIGSKHDQASVGCSLAISNGLVSTRLAIAKALTDSILEEAGYCTVGAAEAPGGMKSVLSVLKVYRTRFFGQVSALNQAAIRVNSWRTSAGVL